MILPGRFWISRRGAAGIRDTLTLFCVLVHQLNRFSGVMSNSIIWAYVIVVADSEHVAADDTAKHLSA